MNYTIIIPHKNTPDLLQKCLDSIPERDDVEIIVIDDNSDESIVDFSHFPGLGRKNTKVILDKSGKGAGYARNLGLAEVKDTKWLIFSDSDDYFTDYLEVAMDKYLNDDSDEVYFKRHSVYVGTDRPATRHQMANARVDEAIASGDVSIIQYKDLAPVCKFVSYRLVKENNIKFEPIRYSNDAMFFLQVGCRLKKLTIDPHPIYVVTEREGSLMKTFSKEAVLCRFYAATRVVALLKTYGAEKYHPNLFAYMYGFSKLGVISALQYFFVALYHTPPKFWTSDLWACYKAFRKGNNKTF